MELLFAPGVSQLLKYDINSSAGYIHTLRILLKNNMNITHTAAELFVHRSTLLERLKRIRKILQVDLDDPDQRLHLLMTLKMIETNEKLTSRPPDTTFNRRSLDKSTERVSSYIELDNMDDLYQSL
jgi:hypothetical protein